MSPIYKVKLSKLFVLWAFVYPHCMTKGAKGSEMLSNLSKVTQLLKPVFDHKASDCGPGSSHWNNRVSTLGSSMNAWAVFLEEKEGRGLITWGSCARSGLLIPVVSSNPVPSWYFCFTEEDGSESYLKVFKFYPAICFCPKGTGHLPNSVGKPVQGGTESLCELWFTCAEALGGQGQCPLQKTILRHIRAIFQKCSPHIKNQMWMCPSSCSETRDTEPGFWCLVPLNLSFGHNDNDKFGPLVIATETPWRSRWKMGPTSAHRSIK